MPIESITKQSVEEHLKVTYGLPEENIKAMLDAAYQSMSENMNMIRQGVEAGDNKKIAYAAHSMKGALLNLGQQECAAVAQRLETSAKEDAPIEGHALLIADIEQSLRYFLN